MKVAFFVSPHGFGHAARAAALVEAWRAADPALEPIFWTTVPRWFFEGSIDGPLGYRELECDVGMVQASATEEDLGATLKKLESFWEKTKTTDLWLRDLGAEVGDSGASGPAGSRTTDFWLESLASEVRDSGASAVVCDVAPLGLLVAREAGLPSVLIESFTWDWIYEGLVAREPAFAPWAERMRHGFALADLHVQAEPICSPFKGSVQVSPIARSPRLSTEEVRSRLGLEPSASSRPLVLVSMGGIETSTSPAALARWREHPGIDFVALGGVAEAARSGNVLRLPHRSPVHHPDLVRAADVVVGKLGYSTVAEAFAGGTRFVHAPRPGFPEIPVLEAWVRSRLPSVALAPGELESGAWVERLAALLAEPAPAPGAADGAGRAVTAIGEFLATRST